MSIEELLLQMEQYRLRREQRDCRPDWLKQFVQQASAVFEPLSHVGRVGYDCQFDERGWTVCMYLGTTEIVGGARDGQIDHASFRIDLNSLTTLFSTVTRFEWYSMGGSATDVATVEKIRSLICVHGSVGGAHEVRLELLATPPDFIGPGLHCRPDGAIYETH
ncbi:MAG: hypothetical protein DWI00_15740 [Planctomycetota bacterium]|nr:MAG: hypothetical protein DWI00_15740 [Planctomycetota bacterium]